MKEGYKKFTPNIIANKLSLSNNSDGRLSFIQVLQITYGDNKNILNTVLLRKDNYINVIKYFTSVLK